MTNQTNISKNPIKLAIVILPFIVTIDLIVPNETSNILTKKTFKHKIVR